MASLLPQLGLVGYQTALSHCPSFPVSPYLGAGKQFQRGGREPKRPITERPVMMPTPITPLSTTAATATSFGWLFYDYPGAVCPEGSHRILQHLALLTCKGDFCSAQLMGLWEVAAWTNGRLSSLPASAPGQLPMDRSLLSSLRDLGLTAKPQATGQGLQSCSRPVPSLWSFTLTVGLKGGRVSDNRTCL